MTPGLSNIFPMGAAQGMAAQPAMWFDGVDDYVSLANYTNGIFTVPYILIMIDIFPSAIDTNLRRVFVHRLNSPGNVGYGLIQSSSGLIFRRGAASDDIVYNNWTAANVNQWFTIAAYNSPSAANLFVNGILCSTGASKSILFSPASVLTALGQGNLMTTFFKGCAKNLKITNITALSESQILSIITEQTQPPGVWLKGNGIDNNAWIDNGIEGTHHGTIYGSPTTCFILPDGRVYKDGAIL